MDLLIPILEAPLEKLGELADRAKAETALATGISAYARGLAAYLGGNSELLSAIARECETELGPRHPASVVLGLRALLCARKLGDLGSKGAGSLKACAITASDDPAWSGELEFVRALCLASIGALEDARSAYESAARLLGEAGAHGKSLKADYNRLCILTQLYPSHPYAHEFESFAAKAKGLGAPGVLAMAQVNLSREYQKAGSFDLALERAEDACRVLREAGLQHSRDEYLARLQRAHVLDDRGDRARATRELEECRLAPFEEIRACIAALEFVIGVGKPPSAPENLPATWAERVRARAAFLASCEGLADLELKVVEILARKPCDKFELIERLYGPELPPLAGENRLKNLLHRIRKRDAELIRFANGAYQLNPRGAR